MSTSSRTDVRTSGAMPRLVRPKWYYIYFFLAAFTLFTVSAGLYLTHRIMSIYIQSVEVNQIWTKRAADFSYLEEMAGAVNAPGNNVFDTHDVDKESARMRAAMAAFDRQIAESDNLLRDGQGQLVTATLLADLDNVSAAMKQMSEEAERIFAHFRAKRSDLAGEHMATMDRKYAKVGAALAHLRGTVSEIQKKNFERQMAAATDLQEFEYAIAILILLMIAGATVYGQQLARQMQADAEEKHRHFTAQGEAEARTRSILGTAADGIVVFDEFGQIETFNKAAERLFGYAATDTIDKDIRSIIPALWERAHVQQADDTGSNSAAAPSVQTNVTMGQHRDGTAFPIELSVSEVRVGGKTIFTGIVRDISDRRQAEEALRIAAAAEAANAVLLKNERRLRLLKDIGEQAGAAESVEAVLRCGLAAVCSFAGWPVGHAWVASADDRALVSSGLWFLDDEAKYTDFRSVMEATRFTVEAGSLIGGVFASRWPAWIADVEQPPLMLREQAMVAAGLHAACAFPILFEQEVEGVLEFFAPESAAADPQFLEFLNQVGSLLGAAARRKRDAAELQKLAMIAQNTDQAVVITDATRVIEWVNPGFTTITGYTLAEVAGRKPGDLLHGEETDPEAIRHIRSVLDAGQKVETEVINYTKSGRKIWMRLSIQPIFDRMGKVNRFIAIEQDITERKAGEEKLRDKEEEIRSIVGSLVDAVISIDARGTVRSFNRSAERLFGYSANEVIGRNVNMLMPEPYHSEHDDYLHNYQSTGVAHIIGTGREVEGQCKDGQRTPLDLAVSEYRIKGERYFTGILRDITERKRVTEELKRARQEAEEASRAKSSFLAAMSHELRTPMNGVVGMIDVLVHTELDADQHEMMATVRESAFSLLGIIDDILDFSKIEAGKLDMERVPVSIAKLVEGVCETLSPIARKKQVELLTFCDPQIPDWVLTDPVRLRQVLFNLAGNAVKFTGSVADRIGKVVIRADFLGMTEKDASICLQITDNGIGMTQETMDKLFQPFTQAENSTTRRFGGTGLGLSICNRLSNLMGGKIEVQSKPDLGSTFRALFTFEIARDVVVVSDRQFDLQNLSVVIVATGELRDILVSYLKHSGAHVLLGEIADDVLHKAIVAKEVASSFVIIVADDENDEVQTTSLRNKFLEVFHQSQTRFVLIQRGRRRTARMAGLDSVAIDANAMRRSALLRAVAVAAGRASPESIVHENFPTLTPGRVPSIDEAVAMGRLILVVEDNKTNQKVIERQLHLLGYAVELADDGHEALSMWKSKRYGLVLTDCHMPKMDGFEFTAALRRQEQCGGSRTPVVAVTANVLKGENERCLAAGMDDYLAKPIPLVSLREMLVKWLPAVESVPGEVVSERKTTDRKPMEENTAVNPDALKEIVGDDPSVVAEFLSDFLVTAREAIADIQAAYLKHAEQDVGAFAHKLKSSARTVGADSLANLCQDLEQAGKTGDWSAIDASIPRMAPCFAAVERFIGRFVG
ncbi:MAG: PAS domain S-box protein [Gallionellaceae bacterium]|nr:PAS domain S-box protein [Gallionellaceae bacterium]